MTAPAVHCSRCGRTVDERALGWTCEHDGPTERWLCPGCTRQHVREIEARLDATWWSP